MEPAVEGRRSERAIAGGGFAGAGVASPPSSPRRIGDIIGAGEAGAGLAILFLCVTFLVMGTQRWGQTPAEHLRRTLVDNSQFVADPAIALADQAGYVSGPVPPAAVEELSAAALNDAYHGRMILPPMISFDYVTWRDVLRIDGMGLVARVRRAVYRGIARKSGNLRRRRHQSPAPTGATLDDQHLDTPASNDTNGPGSETQPEH